MAPSCPQQYTHPRAWTKQPWVGWRAKPHTWCIQTGICCFHFNLHLRVTCPHKSLDKLLFHVLVVFLPSIFFITWNPVKHSQNQDQNPRGGCPSLTLGQGGPTRLQVGSLLHGQFCPEGCRPGPPHCSGQPLGPLSLQVPLIPGCDCKVARIAPGITKTSQGGSRQESPGPSLSL